jgi:hypothetical protein
MPQVRLSITQTEDGRYELDVSGEGFHQAEGEEVDVRLMGKDAFSDDDRLPVFFPIAHVIGGGFGVSGLVKGKTLNEDWGGDEIYATAAVGRLGDFKSNAVRPPTSTAFNSEK